MKYLHGFQLSVLVLFAYGLLGFFRTCFEVDLVRANLAQLRSQRLETASAGFGRVWTYVLAGLGGLIGLWVLTAAGGTDALTKRIAAAGFESLDARTMAAFSVTELWLCFFFFALSAGLILAAGRWVFSSPSGLRNWGGTLALLVALDLGRAAAPWIVHYDYRFRYEANPVVTYLQSRAPDYARTTARLVPFGRSSLAAPQDSKWGAVQNLWLEHHFQYFRIPLLDVIQMPRIPELDEAFRSNFEPKPDVQFNPALVGRLWQLTSTRFLLGAAAIAEQLQSAVALPGSRFVPRLLFDLQPKPGVDAARLNQPDSWTAVVTTNGPYAILEYDAALPKVGLYSSWNVITNDAATLTRLVAPDFDARNNVVLDRSPEIVRPVIAVTNLGEARITAYAPRKVDVAVKTASPAVLLLNDRWHEHWYATLDGQPCPVLRANHIMKAVAVPAGEHQIRFRFDPPLPALKWTVAAIATMMGLLFCLLVVPESGQGRASANSQSAPR